MPQDDETLLPPQPIVFDPSLRLSPTARMISEWAKHGANNEQAVGPGIVRQPWIVCGDKASVEQERVLVHAGARVIRVELDDDGRSSCRLGSDVKSSPLPQASYLLPPCRKS